MLKLRMHAHTSVMHSVCPGLGVYDPSCKCPIPMASQDIIAEHAELEACGSRVESARATRLRVVLAVADDEHFLARTF